jgi:hypothetical protein
MLKPSLEGSIVHTIALGLALTILQPQSSRSGSIVSTIVFRLVATNLQLSSCLFVDYIIKTETIVHLK